MKWDDMVGSYLGLVAEDLDTMNRMFEPDDYEYPIPGEPLVRTPIYRPVRIMLRADPYVPRFSFDD